MSHLKYTEKKYFFKKKQQLIAHRALSLVLTAFLENEDDGNFSVNWLREHHLVMVFDGPQEVGGDSTHTLAPC